MTARPSADDCGGYGIDSVRGQGGKNIVRYEDISPTLPKNNYTLDEFKTDMDSLLTSPELINCKSSGSGGTIAHLAARVGSIEGAKWAVSKGADLTIKSYYGSVGRLIAPYELALVRFGEVDNSWDHKQVYPDGKVVYTKYSLSEKAEWKAKFLHVAKIFAPPPAAATKSCAEVDGQTPLPANEYCIVAENLQSSIETEVSQSLRRLIGVDYIYKAEKYLSGTALYPGYKATITFTCASGIQDCGPAYVPGDRWSDNFLNLVKRTFGLSVKCSDSGNLLDVDSIEPGESVSLTHASDTERSSPWYRNCEAISGGPFTLSIKTTRLAK